MAEFEGTFNEPRPGQNSQTKWFPASITASGLQMYFERCFWGWSFCRLPIKQLATMLKQLEDENAITAIFSICDMSKWLREGFQFSKRWRLSYSLSSNGFVTSLSSKLPSRLLLRHQRRPELRIWWLLIVDGLVVRELQVEESVLERVGAGVFIVDSFRKPSERS